MDTHKKTHTAKVRARKIIARVLFMCIIVITVPAEKVFAASSWNPTLLVNTESFQQIDIGDGTTSVDLRFGASTSTLKLLSSGIFQFNKSLSVVGGISGSYLTIDHQANISGSLVVKNNAAVYGNLSGASFFGAGLGDCNNSTTSKLIYNSTTGKFSCATDQTGGGASSNWSNTGSLQSAFDQRFVNTHGDTMTGALTINVTNGNVNTVGLNVINSLSGAHLHAEQMLSSSGTLRVLSTAIFSSGAVFDTNTLYVNANDNRVGIGTNSPTDVLTVHNATGNAYVHITNQSTGEGPTNGSSIGMNGFGLNIINHDSSFGGPIHFYNSDTIALSAVSGKVGVNQSSPKAQFDVHGTISGSQLSISGNANISGALLVKNSITSRSTVSGANLTFMGATSSYILGNLGIGKSGTINSKLEVVGTISGTTINANSLLTGSTLQGFGLYNCQGSSNKLTYNATTKKFMCETDQTVGSGLDQNAADERFVRKAGDTMTGALVIQNGNTHADTVTPLLSVRGAISGSLLRASNMTVSGAVVYSSGNTLKQSAKGLSGQVLIAQGTSAPKWANPVGGMIWYFDGTQAVATTKGPQITMPFGLTLSGVTLRAKGAPTGAALIYDINKDGVSIFSTRPQIAAGATTGGWTAVLSSTIIPVNSVLTIDIDQVGSTFAGSGVTVMLIGTRKY